jgi:hypothetical protein
MQVANRFHLLQNLGETLERVFHVHSKDLKEVDEAYSQIEVIQTDGTVVAPVPPPPTPTKQEHLAEQRRTRRLASARKGNYIARGGRDKLLLADLVLVMELCFVT